MLIFTVTYSNHESQRFNGNSPVEFGRGPQRGDVQRHVFSQDAHLVSRDHLRIEPLPDEKIRVTCLGRNGVAIDGSTHVPCSLSAGEMCELDLPVTLRTCGISIRIESGESSHAMSSNCPAAAHDDRGAELSIPFWYQTERLLSADADPYCDAVDATVFAPPAAARGATLLVQVFAHTPEQKIEVEQLAQEFDDEAERRGFRSLELEVPRGSLLNFHLTMQGLDIDDPVQSLVWRGQPSAVQFSVFVPAERQIGTSIGTVTASLQSIPLGHVKFKLTILSYDHRPTSPEPRGLSARTYRKAFISYASEDRAEVLKRVQLLSRLKIEFFQDLLNLEPGDRWQQELYRHINECDLFLLFWSSRARESIWVMREVQYALARKRENDLQPPEIIPVIIEGPPPVKPPDELAHLHFNDYLLYFMNPASV